MVVSEPRKTLTKDQIIEILRRNARLFKDEPEFVTYIVDLAMFLIESHLEKGEQKQPSKATFKASPEEINDVYRVFAHFATGKTPSKACPVCGAPVEGRRKCPNCDAMTF